MIVYLLELFIQFKNHKNKCFNVSKRILHNITSHYDYEIDLPDFVKKFKDIIFTS